MFERSSWISFSPSLALYHSLYIFYNMAIPLIGQTAIPLDPALRPLDFLCHSEGSEVYHLLRLFALFPEWRISNGTVPGLSNYLLSPSGAASKTSNRTHCRTHLSKVIIAYAAWMKKVNQRRYKSLRVNGPRIAFTTRPLGKHPSMRLSHPAYNPVVLTLFTDSCGFPESPNLLSHISLLP